MKILSIDTSGRAASAAVVDGRRLLARIWLEHGRTHSQALMPCIEALLSLLGVKAADMDVFAVVVGPGSFTGLRIGVTTAKAMAYANNAKVAAVTTFECLAYNMRLLRDIIICPIIDARNRQVYYQAFYPGDGVPSAACEKNVTGVDDLARELKCMSSNEIKPGSGLKPHRGIVLNGDAAEMYIDYFTYALEGIEVVCAPERDLYTDAASAALIVGSEIESGVVGRLTEPFFLAPDYMRKPQAERVREEAMRVDDAVKAR